MTRVRTARVRAAAVALIALLALTGCVKVHSTTAFTSDNLVTQDLVLAFQDGGYAGQATGAATLSSAVPEPSSIMLLLAGAIVLSCSVRRNRNVP